MLFLINGLACFVRGYGFNVEDQHITLPALKKLLEPDLYPRDFLFTKQLSDFSLYENLLLGPARVLGIEGSFLVLYIAATFAITVAVYRIVSDLFQGRTSGILAAAMLCGAHTAAGTMRLQLFDNYLYPRTVSLAFGLFAYLHMMRSQWPKAALFAGLEFAVHPPSGFTTLTVLGTCMLGALIRKQLGFRELLVSAGAFLLAPSFLLLKMLVIRGGRGTEFLDAMDPLWHRIVHGRTYHMFYGTWPLSRYAQMGFYTALFLVGCRGTNPSGRRVMLTTLCCAVGLNAFNYVVRDLLKLPVFMQIHLEVSIKLFILLGLLHVGPYVWARVRDADWLTRAVGLALVTQVLTMHVGESWHDKSQWAVAATLAWMSPTLLLAALEIPSAVRRSSWITRALQVLSLLGWLAVAWDAAWAPVLVTIAVVAIGREWPPQRARVAVTGALLLLTSLGLLEVGRSVSLAGDFRAGVLDHFAIPHVRRPTGLDGLIGWMLRSTPRSATFLGSDLYSGLRYRSERSYFVTYKDGGQVLYDREYAIQWDLRMAVVRALSRGDEQLYEQAARQFGIDYAIATTRQRLRMPIAFEDEHYIVYDLRHFREAP